MAYLLTNDGAISARVIQDESGRAVVFKREKVKPKNLTNIGWPIDEWPELKAHVECNIRDVVCFNPTITTIEHPG